MPRALLLAAALLGLAAAPAQATPNTFTGDVSDDWYTAANWSDGVPTVDDDIIIPGETVRLASGQIDVSGLSTSGSGSLVVDGASTSLTINGSSNLGSTGALHVAHDAAITFNGNTSWTGGSILFDQNDGELNLVPGTVFDIAGNGLSMTAGPGATTVVRVPSGATLRRSASGTDGVLNAPIANDGLVQAQAGTLRLAGASGTQAGSYEALAPGTLAFGGAGVTYTLSAASRIAGAGTVAFEAGTVVVPPGSTAMPSAFNPANTVFAGGTLSLGSNGTTGTLTSTDGTHGKAGAGNLDVLGTTTMTGGARFTGGTTTLHGTTTIGLGGVPLRVNNGAGLILAGTSTATDAGTFNLTNGALTIAPGGTLDIAADGLSMTDGGSSADLTVQPGGTLERTAAGSAGSISVPVASAGTISVEAGRLTIAGHSLTQATGLTDVAPGAELRVTSPGVLDLHGGTLAGAGTVTAAVDNAGATVAPGASTGILTIAGSYSQGPGGTLRAEMNGTTPGTQHDQLAVTGSATLAGALAIVSGTGYTPQLTDTFTIVTAGSRSGTFAMLTGAQLADRRYRTEYTPTSVRLAIEPGPTNTAPPSIPPSAEPGDTLTCDPGAWSGAQTLTYQWLREGTPIAGATSPTYSVVAADLGKSIVCRVTATNSGGTVIVDSNPVVPGGTPAGPAPPPTAPSPPSSQSVVDQTVRGDAAFAQGTANDLYLACTTLDVVLIDVLPAGRRRVSVTGTADLRLAGRTAGILLGGRRVGSARIAADGDFAARVRAPSRRRRARARYQARVGSAASQRLALVRRMVATSLTRRGRFLVLRGRVRRPFSRSEPIVIERLVSCGRRELVRTARVRPNRAGAFAARIPLPVGAPRALYRARTRVPRRRGGRTRVAVVTQPRTLDLP